MMIAVRVVATIFVVTVNIAVVERGWNEHRRWHARHRRLITRLGQASAVRLERGESDEGVGGYRGVELNPTRSLWPPVSVAIVNVTLARASTTNGAVMCPTSTAACRPPSANPGDELESAIGIVPASGGWFTLTTPAADWPATSVVGLISTPRMRGGATTTPSEIVRPA